MTYFESIEFKQQRCRVRVQKMREKWEGTLIYPTLPLGEGLVFTWHQKAGFPKAWY